MAAILNGLRALGSGRVLEEVLTLVIDSALEVTRADRGFVMLATDRGDLEFRVARARGGVSIEGPSFATSAKIPRDVFATGRTQLVADLVEGLPAGTHDGTIAVGIRHVICVPLRLGPIGAGVGGGGGGGDTAGPRIMGVLYLDGRERATMVSKATLASLEAFATQAALAIDSARLYAESAEKARIEHDLRIAAEIQRALLPEPVWEREPLELAAASVPCRTVGGDFFDYLDLGDAAFGFALGDVAGKGAPAALLATAVQSNFVALAPACGDPAEVMARINRALLRRSVEARFATMFGGVVTDGRLRYCNAGQEPPCLLHGDEVAWLDIGGPVLGLLERATYSYGDVPLAPGDVLVVVSDGVTEARNAADEEFGRDRVVEVVRRCRRESASAVLETLLAEVRAFAKGTPQGDDITALVLRSRDAGAPPAQRPGTATTQP
jgi:phosphoserine phosphatase RsbU/P